MSFHLLQFKISENFFKHFECKELCLPNFLDTSWITTSWQFYGDNSRVQEMITIQDHLKGDGFFFLSPLLPIEGKNNNIN